MESIPEEVVGSLSRAEDLVPVSLCIGNASNGLVLNRSANRPASLGDLQGS